MAQKITHPACGKSWTQHGNRTGHCAKCHETFEGAALFDRHQEHGPKGEVICRDPREMGTGSVEKGTWEPLRLVDDAWKGPEMPKGTFGERS